jgi:hypothetical protein
MATPSPAFLLRLGSRAQRTLSSSRPGQREERVVSFSLNIPYSAQYNMMNKEGHECPPPVFGAPTLVWHLGISPHEEYAQPVSWLRRLWHWVRPPDESLASEHPKRAEKYDLDRQAFYRDINELLQQFYRPLAYPRVPLEPFEADHVPRPWRKPETPKGIWGRFRRWWKGWEHGKPFWVTNPENIRFTLWWPESLPLPQAGPPIDALRIKVHVTAYRDYVTISFYLDAGKPWNLRPYKRGDPVEGSRRQRIFSEIQTIYDKCEARLQGKQGGRKIIQDEILPEHAVSETDAEALRRASHYLYKEIWDHLWRELRLPPLNAFIGETGRVFANFRGLMLSTPGFDSLADLPGPSGDTAFPRFVGNGGLNEKGTGSCKEPNEANAVVKAFWPFIRRITPNADQREYIACGVMNWRALYITALSSARAFRWEEEAESSETDIPAGSLPDHRRGPDGEEIRLFDSQSGTANEGPIRYLVLTKGEPHRRQIGRIVDRINAMGCMRLIALRDWTIIRDASTQIQLRGLELDTIMQRWSVRSTKIQDKHADRWWWPFFPNRRRDKRDEKLQKLTTEVERDLIHLSAALDSIGQEARNGFHFRINRSRFYAAEFLSLLDTLKIGNIDTWVAYDQFVTRGLKPAFDFIDGVGERLVGLRARLQSVLEGIETSALVIQTSATRSNTAQLRRLAFWFRLQNVILAAATALFATDSEVRLNLISLLQSYIIWLWELAYIHLGL